MKSFIFPILILLVVAPFGSAMSQNFSQAPSTPKDFQVPLKELDKVEPQPPSSKEIRALAEQGDAEAQGIIGWEYANSGNDAEAVKWFLKAANQDDGYSETQLGLIYAWGMGVKPDYAESYFWYSLANKHSLPTGNELQSDATHLTDEEKMRLDERVKQWCSKNCKVPAPRKLINVPELHHPGQDVDR